MNTEMEISNIWGVRVAEPPEKILPKMEYFSLEKMLWVPMTFIGKNFKEIGGFGGRSPPRKFCGKMEHFLRKNAKNVTHSDEVHREKLQKKVTILHILSSKLVVPTAKFANNVINFRKRLANLQTITRKFEDNVAVPNPRSILFFTYLFLR